MVFFCGGVSRDLIVCGYTNLRCTFGEFRIVDVERIVGTGGSVTVSISHRALTGFTAPRPLHQVLGRPSRQWQRKIVMFTLSGVWSGVPCQMPTSSPREYPARSGYGPSLSRNDAHCSRQSRRCHSVRPSSHDSPAGSLLI